MANIRLEIERLGPLENTDFTLKGSMTLLFGEPSSGKSYTLKALYASLSILDPIVKDLCKKVLSENRYNLVVGVEDAGIELISELVALSALVAANPQESPTKIAEDFGLKLSRYTIKERGRIAEGGRKARVELRVSRTDQQPLGKYTHGRVIRSIISAFTRCLSKRLLPEKSRFRLHPKLDPADPRNIGSENITIYNRGVGEAEWSFIVGDCNVDVKRVWGEIAYSEGYVVLRSLESTVIASDKCSRTAIEELVGKLKTKISKDRMHLEKIMERKLKRLAVEKARTAVSEAVGYTDIIYISFLRGSALLLRALASRLPDSRKARLIEALLREPETASIGIVYYRIGRGLWGLSKLSAVTEQAVKLLFSLGNVKVEVERGLKLESREVEVNVGHASGLAVETASIALALAGSRGRPLILLEEPESQLHPEYHVITVIALASIAGILNASIAVSTHSDLMAATLASLALSKEPSKPAYTILRRAGLEGDLLEAAVKGVEKAARRGFSFYLFEEGRIRPVDPKTVVGESPSHGKALDLLYKAFLPSDEG